MSKIESLIRGDKLDPSAIASSKLEPAVVAKTLAERKDVTAAAVAIVAGLRRLNAATEALIARLGDEGLSGRAAAWALGQLDSEKALLAAIAKGNLDVRTNGYAALATLAARGSASPELTTRMRERLEAELERVAQGRSGLSEHVCRVLAVLGAPGTLEAIQDVLVKDRFAERSELHRLAKQLEREGKANETIAALKADWKTQFAADLVQVEKEAEQQKAAAPAPEEEEVGEEEAPPPGEAGPVDWSGFAKSAEGKKLEPQAQQRAVQLGQVLEQLAARAVGVPLTEVTGEELAALVLQVMPQALPPQMLQAALSPKAINALQALAQWLVSSGKAKGDLVQGVKLVREQLQAQLRASGMLGGPDYREPGQG